MCGRVSICFRFQKNVLLLNTSNMREYVKIFKINVAVRVVEIDFINIIL